MAGGGSGGAAGGGGYGGSSFGGYGSTRSPGGTGYGGGGVGGYGTAGEMSGGAGGAGMAGYGGGGQAGVANSGWGGPGGSAGRQPAGGTYSNDSQGHLTYSTPAQALGYNSIDHMAAVGGAGVVTKDGVRYYASTRYVHGEPMTFMEAIPTQTSALRFGTPAAPGYVNTKPGPFPGTSQQDPMARSPYDTRYGAGQPNAYGRDPSIGNYGYGPGGYARGPLHGDVGPGLAGGGLSYGGTRSF